MCECDRPVKLSLSYARARLYFGVSLVLENHGRVTGGVCIHIAGRNTTIIILRNSLACVVVLGPALKANKTTHVTLFHSMLYSCIQ